jgi:hypothetical protein
MMVCEVEQPSGVSWNLILLVVDGVNGR